MLQDALNEAHRDGVISYPDESYRDSGPCYSSFDLRDRILRTTKDARAEAFLSDVKREID